MFKKCEKVSWKAPKNEIELKNWYNTYYNMFYENYLKESSSEKTLSIKEYFSLGNGIV